MVRSQSEISPQEVWTKMLCEGYYSKQFTTGDTVPPFSLAEGSAGVCDHMFASGFIELGQEDSYSCVARIRVQNERLVELWES